jgi:hypothetical protein
MMNADYDDQSLLLKITSIAWTPLLITLKSSSISNKWFTLYQYNAVDHGGCSSNSEHRPVNEL